MYELSIEDFTKYVVDLIEDLGNITLSNPDTTETFPCCVVSNAMQSLKITEDNIPVKTRFSINIEWWTSSKYTSMNYYQKTNELLRKYNFAQIGNQAEGYDDITKKYRYGGRYEVNFNGLTNSFERVI